MTDYRTTPLIDGLAFPEGPRWHADRLWFTDQHAHTVCAVSTTGDLQIVAHTDDLPGGLGWLPDGSLLVVYMTQRRIMRLADGRLTEYVALADLASFHCNDMLVDRGGRIFVGNFGFDLHGGEAVGPAELIEVDPARHCRVVADDVVFPNGCALSPDGRQLLVAETFAHRIREFAIDGEGKATSAGSWAALGDATPDGICLDAEGALWIASPRTKALLRVKQDGIIVDRCETIGTPYACMLGADDRRTLYVCTAETDDPKEAAARRTGRIEQTRVAVPGAGLP